MSANLKDTIPAMTSSNYKDRFLAEYWQTKVRYEKLKAMMNKWDAYTDYKYHVDHNEQNSRILHLEDFLGFKPACSYDLLKEQQKLMGELLHILEVRAAIEDIPLDYDYLNQYDDDIMEDVK